MSTRRTAATSDRRKTILYVTVSVAIIALIGVVAYFTNHPDALPTASVAPTYAKLAAGSTAPDFSVSTTNGPFTLSKARGKPTLLELFAVWCPHCQRETVVLNALYASFKDRVHFVAVNASPNASETDPNAPATQASVVQFGQAFKVAYPLAYDPDLTVAHQYLLGGFPTIVLIGPGGKIQATASGELGEGNIRTALAASLAGTTPDPTFGSGSPS